MDTSNLMEQILSDDNLFQAYLHVKRNNGAAGIDKMKCNKLVFHLIKYIERIKEDLQTGEYIPQPVRRVKIPKPDGGMRDLGIPVVRDRFVQQAIAQILTPIYEKQFHEHSFGFRPNKGAHKAIQKTVDLMNNGFDWIVDIDLEKFFDTVNHDKLIEILRHTIKDEDVILIIEKFLKSGAIVKGQYEDSLLGTPQGGNMSPLLSNIMLNELDKELSRRGLNFIRYADDCIVLVRTQKSAMRVMKNITRYIEDELCLKVNMTKSKVDKPQGIKYLGFGFEFDRRMRKYRPIPHPISVQRFNTKIQKLISRNFRITNKHKIEQLNYLILGWTNYYCIADIKSLCKILDKQIRYQLRMRIWEEWNNPKIRRKKLIELGANRKAAYLTAHTRTSTDIVCHKITLTTAISKDWLSQFGVISMLDYYKKKYAIPHKLSH